MKKIPGILTLILSLVILFSCEPSRDGNGDFLIGINQGENGTGEETSVGKKLKSVTSKNDAAEIITYNYSYLAGQLVNVTTSDHSISYNLFYENNLINKMNIVEIDGGVTTTTKFAITYSKGKFLEANGTGSENVGNKFTNKLTPTYTDNKISKMVSKREGVDSANSTIIIDTKGSDYDMKGNLCNMLPEVYNAISALYGFDATSVTGFSTNNY